MIYPITYNEPLFRPPSEGKSLIIQVTLGCSWNKCAFCEMYTSKSFKPRKEADIINDIEAFLVYKEVVTKVFLADGDPLVLSNKRLIPILQKIVKSFPNLKRISTYASPTNIRNKTKGELDELKANGLSLLYIGIESGDDKTLDANQKGETFESTIEGINKAHASGFETSVMIINGVGGKINSNNHAIKSAEVLNATQPKFASTLVLTMHKGKDHYLNRYKGDFIELNSKELVEEMKLFFEKLELKNTIFRSNHASNHLVFKGVLGDDKRKFLAQIDYVLENADKYLSDDRRVYGY